MAELKIIRQFYSWAFSGEFPDIPVPEDIDIAELTRGDSDPMFVTLPFSERNAVADDGLRYNDGFNSKLVAEINSKRSTGLMGHLRPEDRGSVFDVPAVQWLAAMTDENGRTWGKAYVLPNEGIRQFVRASKATKRGIATSIYGMAPYDAYTFNPDGTYEVDPAQFELESLDLAPIERAALKIDRPVQITAHMDTKIIDEEKMPLTAEIIAQLTAEQAALIPAPVRDAIIAQYNSTNENKAKIEQLNKDNTDLLIIVAQLKQQIANQDNELFEDRLDDEINGAVKVDDVALKGIVKNAVLAHLKGEVDFEKAKTVLAQYVESDTYKKIAGVYVAQLTGGNAIIAAPNSTQGTLGEQMEKKIDALRAQYGVGSGK